MRARVGSIIVALACATVVAPPARADGHTVTYVGVVRDQRDFTRFNIGNAGYWFPQFAAPGPVEGRPTGENARDALPAWAGPLNHATVGDPTFGTRTFSQDGPARSEGGQPSWDTLTLPNGETGLSGAIVDPHTKDNNSNNTINRIRLGDGVPETFYVHVLTDNTRFEHDPEGRLRARGKDVAVEVPLAAFPSGETGAPGPAEALIDGSDIEPDRHPGVTGDLRFNGAADIYSFRYDGFEPGDYIKLQLAGGPNGGSFGGLMFDETFDASDADGDGLLDGDDRCPDAAAPTASGCPEAERSLTLAGGKKRFTGMVTSPTAPACSEGVPVSLWKDDPAGDVRIATATTDQDGHYGVSVNAGRGSYYADVGAETIDGVADCLAARSRLLRIR